MNKNERESILVISKFLAICKEDSHKFSFLRNYLHNKIIRLLEKKRSHPSSDSEFRPFIHS